MMPTQRPCPSSRRKSGLDVKPRRARYDNIDDAGHRSLALQKYTAFLKRSVLDCLAKTNQRRNIHGTHCDVINYKLPLGVVRRNRQLPRMQETEESQARGRPQHGGFELSGSGRPHVTLEPGELQAWRRCEVVRYGLLVCALLRGVLVPVWYWRCKAFAEVRDVELADCRQTACT